MYSVNIDDEEIKIPDYYSEYDKYCKDYYGVDLFNFCNKYGVSANDIKRMINTPARVLIRDGVITPINKYLCLTLILNRDITLNRLLENEFYNYDDVLQSIKIMPPCMKYISKKIYDDVYFMDKLLDDNFIYVLFNNLEYLPKCVIDNKHFKEKAMSSIDVIIINIKNNFELYYSKLLLYPEYLLDNPKFQSIIIDNIDDIIDTIKADQSFINKCPDFLINNKEFLNKYIEILDINFYDKLPANVAKLTEVRKKCNRTKKIYNSNNRDKNGYNTEWKNEKGLLIQFFKLKEGYVINNKSEYYIIYKKYIESKLSVNNFCSKYGITPVSGFNKFLDRMSSENFEISNEINNINNNISNDYYDVCRDNIDILLSDNITFEEFITNKDVDFTIANINFFFNNILKNEDEKYIFICKLIDYVQNNSYLMHEKFIEFLKGDEGKLSINFDLFVRGNAKHDRTVLKKFQSLVNVIKEQSVECKSEKLYCNGIIGNKEYTIDDKIIDQATAYSNDNGYHICQREMQFLCKQIAIGNIIYEKETNELKEEIVDDIISLTYQKNKLEYYFEKMEKNVNKKSKIK